MERNHSSLVGYLDFNHHRSTCGETREKPKCEALYLKKKVKLRGGLGRWQSLGRHAFTFCQMPREKGESFGDRRRRARKICILQ
jgi:hypothetical protein